MRRDMIYVLGMFISFLVGLSYGSYATGKDAIKAEIRLYEDIRRLDLVLIADLERYYLQKPSPELRQTIDHFKSEIEKQREAFYRRR